VSPKLAENYFQAAILSSLFTRDYFSMNKIIFALSITASAGLGFLAGKYHDASDISAHPVVFLEQEQKKTPVVRKLTSTSTENNFQAGGVVTSEKVQILPNTQSAEVTSQTTQEQIDAIKAEYELKQRSEKFTDWLIKNQKEKAWFDLGVEMRGRFDAEERDYNWANAEEGSLQSLFAQEQALAGIALKSTTCKSTQCQITISVLDQDHANETAMIISNVLGGKNFSQIIIDSQVQQGEAIFYVSRNEKGFEFN
jgi:hypothetical protein